MSHYERLSALDASFLGIETEHAHMHVGALIVLEGGPLATADGGVDFERIKNFLHGALCVLPRYRQRLEFVPGLRHPVWVDDAHFNIHYHVRHTALPRPGDERTLKRMAGRIFSQRLDRSRPMWELWVVEGLEGGRFALIPKAHHCMVDGVSGVDFMTALLRGTPDESMVEIEPWEPRPAPTKRELLMAELEHRARGSRSAWTKARSALQDIRGWWDGARDTATGLVDTLSAGIVPASPSPINPKKIGRYRRFDVTRLELSAVKAVKKELGGKLNDVVLATATGALIRFMKRRGADPSKLTDFRALVPVNVRKPGDAAGGNKVSMMFANLPLAWSDPLKRFERVCETTAYLKTESKQVESSQIVEGLGDLTAVSMFREVLRLASRQRTYNVVITNVPGPPFPLYLLGAKIEAMYPLVPLLGNQALGMALFSYTGGLYWGLSADWESMPDLHEFTEDLQAAFAELADLAGVKLEAAPELAALPSA